MEDGNQILFYGIFTVLLLSAFGIDADTTYSKSAVRLRCHH